MLNYALLTEFQPEPVNHERRKLWRFPIQRAVGYKQGEKTGTGSTINISSHGLLLTADEPPVFGEAIELSVDWPAELDCRVRLKLLVAGRVVRVEGTNAAVAIDRYEFRTTGPKLTTARRL